MYFDDIKLVKSNYIDNGLCAENINNPKLTKFMTNDGK